MFHRHKWIEKERFYAAPMAGLTKFKTDNLHLGQQLTQGVTTIRYECECTKSKTEEILGKSMKEPNPSENHKT